MDSNSNNILQGCLSNIKSQTALMNQCLNDGNLLQALKHCSNFLSELRTSQLTPKQYYELYIMIFDSMEVLSQFLLASYNSKKSRGKINEKAPFLADLYELVQYSGNIVPRLYMMILIGTTYMATNDSPSKDIMKDMIEMCRGVQHPVRGLFLRYYLSQKIKDLLPKSNESELHETINFLISNFIEMNKLWVRLQHQGHSSEREIRYKERKELKILVGSNLFRLSQIIDDYAGDENYSSVQYYKTDIFPVITEQIVQCRDHLAQSYLVDVLIQIFPTMFHFATLKELLNVFMNLQPSLNKSDLVSTLIERCLTEYNFEIESRPPIEKLSLEAEHSKEQEISYVDLFDYFWDFYLELNSSNLNITDTEQSSILRSLIELTVTFDPTNNNNLNKIYEYGLESMKSLSEDEEKLQERKVMWSKIMQAPVEKFHSLKKLLGLSFFYEFYSSLNDSKLQKQISVAILDRALRDVSLDEASTNVKYDTQDEIHSIFRYLIVLITDSDDVLTTSKDLGIVRSVKISNSNTVSYDFLNIQEKLAKILHFAVAKKPEDSISNLFYIRKMYLSKAPQNMLYTYPTLVSLILNQLRYYGHCIQKGYICDFSLQNSFKNLSLIIDELYKHHSENSSEHILQIYLNAALVADQLRQENSCYELFMQCFVVYEEKLMLNLSSGGVPDPRDSNGGSLPFRSIILIANSLYRIRYLSKDSYESLITKLTLYGSKLLKKHEQCRSVYYCAHLWWWCDMLIDGSSPVAEVTESTSEEAPKLYRNEKRVLECLQKALRVADSCMDPYLSLQLFVEILNRCSIFSLYGNNLINMHYISGLIELIKTNISNLKEEISDIQNPENAFFEHTCDYFERTLQYIQESLTTGEIFSDAN